MTVYVHNLLRKTDDDDDEIFVVLLKFWDKL